MKTTPCRPPLSALKATLVIAALCTRYYAVKNAGVRLITIKIAAVDA